jgi:hypothetical protein
MAATALADTLAEKVVGPDAAAINLQNATGSGAAPGRPAVQPCPVRRRPDRGRLRYPAEGHGRP